MKYLKSAICILLVCLMLTGCSFRMASSIDDLISPVSPFGDNADIQKAMDSYAKNGYSLKVPVAGKYNTSYNFYDIDGDGNDEAFAFYEPADKLGSIDMAVIKKIDGIWSVVDNVTGDGKEIYSVDFHDLTGDGKKDILICWDVIKNSTNHQLAVYSYSSAKSSFKLKQIGIEMTINNYTTVDFNGDKIDELLLMFIGTGHSNSATAELYSLKGANIKSLGYTKLDSHITSYTKLSVGKVDNDIRVYADAIGSDGKSMLTEVLYWSDSYKSVISPFYSYSTGRTSGTSRSAMISSMDINNDGVIEIPTDTSVSKLPKQVMAVDWQTYKHTTLIHTDYSLFVPNDGYSVIVPDKYKNKIAVSYDEKTRKMTVTNNSTKKTVFSVVTVMKAVYDKNNFKGYSSVLDTSGYYYLAQSGNDSDIKITVGDIKNYIKAAE